MSRERFPKLLSESLSREIERVFEDFFPTFSEEKGFYPHLDIAESENEIVIKADVPGMTQKDISIEIHNDQLIIRGEKKEEEEVKKKNIYISERRYGKFARRITLPDYVDPEKTKAKIKDGVLTITIPKKEEVKPKKISVQIE